MQNLSGQWTGRITGTNSGRISFALSQDDNLLSGEGAIHDDQLGTYRYTVAGRVSPSIQLQMMPAGKVDRLRLGVVSVTAVREGDDLLIGKWVSQIGTRGEFHAERRGVDSQAQGRAEGGARERRPQAQVPRVLRPGVEIDSYRLMRRLGRGMSSEVWQAQVVVPPMGIELREGEDVAVKFYSPMMMHGTQSMRIQREFSIAAETNHPGLAKVYDLILSPSRPFHTFMVMEYIEGRTLKDVITQSGPMDAEQVKRFGITLFGALDELHTIGAIHRDVKAANIMVPANSVGRPGIKLVDLGIVAVTTEDRLTAGSVFMGSKHSAPLEQLTGEEVTESVDIYGAGTVLFHCLTGRPMYDKVGAEGAIVRRMLDRPEVLEPRDGVPSNLIDFVNRCIAVQKADRPPNARKCMEDLRNM